MCALKPLQKLRDKTAQTGASSYKVFGVLKDLNLDISLHEHSVQTLRTRRPNQVGVKNLTLQVPVNYTYLLSIQLKTA